ncbi:BZ3500_MvSof-1268-A1-R1_Chr2-1g04700 [Microbotryum saponariae]|uniref:BZ3500_MvSof-1268-A1-R1_Chr2-1g04700 protein n=1 Tax=Microbotryum saponariae TaxID=289078 RepID=A0A2X0MAQ6_9BASI|nr:BZ3500_MvSof-1268-A1-R1_Chr2-1g04700 [Microbotryum saponariae]SCZ92354.1 BZ3501_MvSof-1269-A2-R1_Chr2-1g04356 [Microbotryum saponariae]
MGSVVSPMADPTLSLPHHHLFMRKGACAGLEWRSNPSSPTFRSATTSASDGRVHPLQGSALGVRKVEGKVRLPPPPQPNPECRKLLEGSDSEAKAFRENARSYNNALSFTSLAAHFDQIRLGTLGPPCSRTWLIDPVEATDTRLGPNSPDRRIQRSTLTKLESKLRTNNRFVRLLRPTHPQPSYVEHGNGDTHMRFRHQHGRSWTVGPNTKSLARSIRPRCLSVTHYFFLQGKMASTPTFLFAGSTKPGRQSPETESRSTMVSNCARYLPVSVWMTKTYRRTKTATMRMKTARKGTKIMVMVNDEGQVKGSRSRWRVSRSQFFAHYLPKATSTSQSRIAPNVPSWKPTPHHDPRHQRLDPEPNRDITQRYQDAMACVVKHGKPPLLITMTYDPRLTGNQGCTGADKACNRPDLIARVFEAKPGNKRHAGCFGDECKMNRFCFFAVLRIVFS